MTTDLVISAQAARLRRALGPTSWVVLEELLQASEPAADDVSSATRSSAVSVRDLARRLGLDKDTVARAVHRLIDAELVSRCQIRTGAGTFARTTYLIDIPDGLHLLDHTATDSCPSQSLTSPTTSSPASLARTHSPARSTSLSSPVSQLSLLDL